MSVYSSYQRKALRKPSTAPAQVGRYGQSLTIFQCRVSLISLIHLTVVHTNQISFFLLPCRRSETRCNEVQQRFNFRMGGDLCNTFGEIVFDCRLYRIIM